MTVLSPELLENFEPSVLDVNEASMLPPLVYTSEEFYAFEREAIFGHEWLCVGRVDQVPEPGDYFTLTMADEPLVVVRGQDRVLRVLSAVCRHRGALVAEDRGTCGAFVCPYHHWSYALDGRLLGSPAMDRAIGFDKKEHPLPSLRVEEWQGFVFCNMDQEAPPLAPGLSELEPLLEHFELPSATTLEGKTLPDLPWNWKV